jgi:tryptophan synthase beta chain
MKLFGAELRPVHEGAATLKEAVNAAMREWVSSANETAYCLGSAVGPAPYPRMVREFQRVIGVETLNQLDRLEIDAPDAVFACVGGGSNASGFFSPFVDMAQVSLVGCEAEGAASLVNGRPGTDIQVVIGLFYLKSAFNLSDEQLLDRWVENPYWQWFCGFETMQHKPPIDPTTLSRWRSRLGSEKLKCYSKRLLISLIN